MVIIRKLVCNFPYMFCLWICILVTVLQSPWSWIRHLFLMIFYHCKYTNTWLIDSAIKESRIIGVVTGTFLRFKGHYDTELFQWELLVAYKWLVTNWVFRLMIIWFFGNTFGELWSNFRATFTEHIWNSFKILYDVTSTSKYFWDIALIVSFRHHPCFSRVIFAFLHLVNSPGK